MNKAIGTITWKPTPKHKRTTLKSSHKRSSTNKHDTRKMYRGQGR
jgi:hypothetical protein